MPFIVIDAASAAAAPSVTVGDPLTSTGRTLEAMRTELDLKIGSRSDVDSPRIDQWINEAYYDLATMLDFPELLGSFSYTLTVDQPLYNLPTHLRKILGVAVQLPSSENVNEGYPLDKIDFPYYRKLAVDEGDPKLYFRVQHVLVLYPTADTARTLVVDAQFRPIKLTNVLHSPVLPLEWHEGIELIARAKAFSALMEWDKAREAQNDFTDWIRVKEDPEAAEDEARVIRSSVPYKHGGVRRGKVWRNEMDY